MCYVGIDYTHPLNDSARYRWYTRLLLFLYADLVILLLYGRGKGSRFENFWKFITGQNVTGYCFRKRWFDTSNPLGTEVKKWIKFPFLFLLKGINYICNSAINILTSPKKVRTSAHKEKSLRTVTGSKQRTQNQGIPWSIRHYSIDFLLSFSLSLK